MYIHPNYDDLVFLGEGSHLVISNNKKGRTKKYEEFTIMCSLL